MFDNMKTKLYGFAAVGSAAMVATPAFAQSVIDVSEATDALAGVATAVGTIGLAMVAAISAGIAYRWVVAYLAK